VLRGQPLGVPRRRHNPPIQPLPWPIASTAYIRNVQFTSADRTNTRFYYLNQPLIRSNDGKPLTRDQEDSTDLENGDGPLNASPTAETERRDRYPRTNPPSIGITAPVT
jgi:hypothetical protein